jgi:hypothetical protein
MRLPFPPPMVMPPPIAEITFDSPPAIVQPVVWIPILFPSPPPTVTPSESMPPAQFPAPPAMVECLASTPGVGRNTCRGPSGMNVSPPLVLTPISSHLAWPSNTLDPKSMAAVKTPSFTRIPDLVSVPRSWLPPAGASRSTNWKS